MAASVEPLSAQDTDALRSFLVKEPVQNLYLLGLLEEFGVVPRPDRAPFTFYGRFEKRALTAVLFVGGSGGLVVPSASEPALIGELCQSLEGQLTLRSARGERAAVEEVLRRLRPQAPSFSRLQRLMSVSADDLGPFTNPTLRLATLEDLPDLIPLAAGWVRECRDRNPLEEDPEGFRLRVTQRVRAQRTYVLRDTGRIVFKVDVGSRSRWGAELEGLYTHPENRRQRHAILSLGQISRHLLSSLPRLTLRVDEQNAAMNEIARRVGYVPHKPQKLVLFD